MQERAGEYRLMQRAALVGFGALAATAIWALVDGWNHGAIGDRVFVAVFTALSVFAGVTLAVAGPLTLGRATAAAAVLAVPLSGLMTWASMRFADPDRFLDSGPGVLIAGLIALLATPFLALAAEDRRPVLDYARLFDAAWTITVRTAAAWAFLAAFWAVVLMSNALLELVGIDLIEILFQTDWLRFAVSGAVLGLGLAVAYELRDFVSPHLILRLLRLLLPILLVVVGIFLAALPLRGLSGLFGDFSTAATLMGVALGAITLISTALDREDAEGIRTPGMKFAARGLALMLPVLTTLAAWSVALRVAQYGWTPDRVLAATAAAVIAVYGLAYAVAALRGRGWRARIRQANVWMALVALGAACLWLTPVLNPERISADNQVARFLDGRSDLSQLPVWRLHSDWGVAGQSALDRVVAQSGDPQVAAHVAAARGAGSLSDFSAAIGESESADRRADVARRMLVRPEGAVTLDPELFSDLPAYRLEALSDGCETLCLWISAAFLPGLAATDQAVILAAGPDDRVMALHVVIVAGRIARVREMYDLTDLAWGAPPLSALRALAEDTRAPVRPSGILGLQIGDTLLIPAP